MTTARPLLEPADLDALRRALAPLTVEALHEALGPIGQAAHTRGDLAGVARAVRTFGDDRLATLVRLFVLGTEVDAAAARTALGRLPVAAAAAAGLVQESAGAVRGRLDIRPYGEAGRDTPDPWWVVSDFGSDVRGAPVETDHVLGIGAAALTLAQATPRDPVDRAVDIGTGCGVQALHLGRHAARVTATDISARALRLAATTAALSGQGWDLREGSLLDPIDGETADLVVANPPFVVSPPREFGAADRYDYRDSGYAGDEVCRRLVAQVPSALATGGTAQLLANWIIPGDGSGRERLESWFDDTGCHAWVWQRELAEPAEYVTLWLRDAGETPGTAAWTTKYDAWLDWFATAGVAAIGMGLITMWRADPDEPTAVVVDDVPQPLGAPLGPHVAGWIDRQRWLACCDDETVLDAPYRVDADLVRTSQQLIDPDGGWREARATLRQSHGMRWELELDDDVAGVVAACAAGSTPALAAELIGATRDIRLADVSLALSPVLRDLVARGFLIPRAADREAGP